MVNNILDCVIFILNKKSCLLSIYEQNIGGKTIKIFGELQVSEIPL